MGIALPLLHLSLLLLLSISFNHVGHLVSADDTLIQLQCHNAEVPSICIQCVKSDPRSQLADKVGIANIVITCLSNNARTLSKNMTDLASEAHDKDVKMVLQGCAKGFSVATENLANATSMLVAGDYDKTNSLVSAALSQEMNCMQYTSEYKVEVPYSVVYDMRVYEELSEAAMRIIDRF